MNFKIIVSAIVFSVVVSLSGLPNFSLAKDSVSVDLDGKSIAILPTSPFYFVKEIGRGIQMFFAFNAEKKAELKAKIAEDKLIEAKIISEREPENKGALEKALQNYEEQRNELKARLQNLTDTSKNPNISTLVQKIDEKLTAHAELFNRLIVKIGEKPSPHIISPKTGDKWVLGNTYEIIWFGGRNPKFNVWIYIPTSDGKFLTIAPKGTPDSGSYSWFIPTTFPIGEHQINIEVFGDSGKSFRRKSGFFEIVSSSTQTFEIKIISPNGGEVWKIGDEVKIEWSSKNIEKVFIFLEADKGGSYRLACGFGGNIPASDGNYKFILKEDSCGNIAPSDHLLFPIKPGQYKIKIMGDGHTEMIPKASDESDAPFSIVSANQASEIKIISPNGEETFKIGQTYPIRWNPNSASTVKIALIDTRYDYFSESPLGSVLITVDVPNTGIYYWKVPSQITDALGRVMELGVGKIYKVMIYSALPGGDCKKSVCDQSDGIFSIVPDDGVRG